MSAESSYFDLTAEVKRKEEEVTNVRGNKKKCSDKASKTFDKIQAMSNKRKKKKTTDTREDAEEVSHTVDDETIIMYNKAKMKLTAKSKIYDKMKNGEMEDFENIYGETKYLVDFQQKVIDEDKDDQSTILENEKETVIPSSIMEANELYKEKLHAKWEKEQQEILEGPVHYENIKFDEVRDLGTGYFAFSKNEEERKKQLEDLNKLREDTKNTQAKKELLKKKRKAALEERLNKVKQRKSGNDISVMDQLNELSNEIKNFIPDEKKVEKDKTINEDLIDSPSETSIDRMLKDCRKASIKEREWDKGKNSTSIYESFVPKKPKVTSLESIIKERREERNEDFAPPSFY